MAGRFSRWMDGVGDSWVTFGGFLEVFPQFGLKTGHYRKTYKIPCISIGCSHDKNDGCWR